MKDTSPPRAGQAGGWRRRGRGTEVMGLGGGSEDHPVVSFHSLGPQETLQETLTTHCPGWGG